MFNWQMSAQRGEQGLAVIFAQKTAYEYMLAAVA
jgi:hypothetical protein